MYGSVGPLGQRTCITSRENMGLLHVPRASITLKAQFEPDRPWRRANMVPEVLLGPYCYKQSSVPHRTDRHTCGFTPSQRRDGTRMEISSCSGPHKISKVTLHAEMCWILTEPGKITAPSYSSTSTQRSGPQILDISPAL